MADEKHLGAEIVGASLSSKVTQGGAVVGVAGWLAEVNWIGVLGVFIALAGLFVNIYFQRRRDKREEEESKARIEAIRYSRDAS